MAGEYIPPLWVEILADARPMLEAVAEAKAALEDLSDTPTTVTIDGDNVPFQESLAEARAIGDAVTAEPITFTVTADVIPAISAAALGAQVLSRQTTGGGSMFGGLAGAAASHFVASGGGGGGFIPGSGGGSTSGGDDKQKGFWGLVAAGLFSKNQMQKVLGTGAGAGWWGLPGEFSLLSLAGFGASHLAMTGLGLAGSAVGAGLGGGLLAAGGAGVMAVGGGSDMAVMKSVMTDTFTAQTSLYARQTALNNAILIYGKNSAQAAAATTDLNNQMTILGNTAGVAAENGLAQAVVGLNAYWDQATSGARVAAVGILSQAVQLANQFIPMVAQAAQTNFGIISDGLKPLLAWLSGPQGVGVFNTLEQVFASNLPYAVGAFNQAIEFLLRTFQFLAPMTGGFVRMLDNLFTTANSPAGFAKWETIMRNLIGTFRIWEDLIKNLVRDVYDLFSQSAGTASSIVVSLDGMLIRLGAWERSTQGKAAIDNIFTVHRQEIDQLLRLLPPFLESLGRVYLVVAPALTGALVTVLSALSPVLTAITSTGWGAWLVGLTLIAGKVGLLGKLLSPLGGLVTTALVWLGKLALGWVGVQTAADAAAASELAAGAGGDAKAAKGLSLTGGGLLGGESLESRGGLIGVLAAIATGLGLAGGAAGTVVGQAVGGKGSTAQGAGSIIGTQLLGGPLVGSILNVVEHWDQVRDALVKAATVVGGFFHDLPGHIADIAGTVWTGVVHFFQSVGSFFASLPGRIAGFFGMVLGAVGRFFQALPAVVQQLAFRIGYFIGSVIGNVVTFFVALPGRIAGFFEQLPGHIADFFKTVGGWFLSLPGRIVGFFQSVPAAGKNMLGEIAAWFVSLPGRIWSAFTGLVGNVVSALGTIGHWIWQLPGMVWSGITGLASTVLSAIKDLAGGIGNAILGLIGTVGSFFKGIISGIASHLPGGQSHAIGGTIAAGTWGIINDGTGPEPIYARPFGGVDVISSSRVSSYSPSGGGGTTNVTINSRPVFNISGLPSQVIDMVDAKLQSNNQQLVAALGA